MSPSSASSSLRRLPRETLRLRGAQGAVAARFLLLGKPDFLLRLVRLCLFFKARQSGGVKRLARENLARLVALEARGRLVEDFALAPNPPGFGENRVFVGDVRALYAIEAPHVRGGFPKRPKVYAAPVVIDACGKRLAFERPACGDLRRKRIYELVLAKALVGHFDSAVADGRFPLAQKQRV